MKIKVVGLWRLSPRATVYCRAIHSWRRFVSVDCEADSRQESLDVVVEDLPLRTASEEIYDRKEPTKASVGTRGGKFEILLGISCFGRRY